MVFLPVLIKSGPCRDSGTPVTDALRPRKSRGPLEDAMPADGNCAADYAAGNLGTSRFDGSLRESYAGCDRMYVSNVTSAHPLVRGCDRLEGRCGIAYRARR